MTIAAPSERLGIPTRTLYRYRRDYPDLVPKNLSWKAGGSLSAIDQQAWRPIDSEDWRTIARVKQSSNTSTDYRAPTNPVKPVACRHLRKRSDRSCTRSA